MPRTWPLIWLCKSLVDSGFKPLSYQMGGIDPAQNPNSGTAFPTDGGLSSAFDHKGWGFYTEEQLVDILLKRLDCLYAEAISKLVEWGHDEEVALKAILKNGHCYGRMDAFTNIMNNTLGYLKTGCIGNCENSEYSELPPFEDLKQLEECSLAGLVCLLQHNKPHLSRGDAMWCLLMSDLHLGRAIVLEIPVLPSPNGNGGASTITGSADSGDLKGVVNGPVGVASSLCRFHSGWGFGNGGTAEFPVNGRFSCASESSSQKEIDFPKRFNLTPSMKSLLKRNVAFFAAEFRASARNLQSQLQTFQSSLPNRDSSSSASATKMEKVPGLQTVEPQNVKNQDVVNSVLNKFKDLNLGENSEKVSLDPKYETIISLIHQIKDLKRQVKERKDWAHQKAIQAAKKLSHDLTELKMLKMEREEMQRLKKVKQNLEASTKKSLTEMDNASKKVSCQVDRANAAVRKLETENAEIRAEMEASKLSASESVASCSEAAKREKKYLKKLLAWEKQKAKLQEDIAEDKRKISDIKIQIAEIEAAQKEAEAKWRQEQKDKELALEQVEEERRLKETTEVNSKSRLEALRLKSAIDFQRQRDDLQRLEQEIVCLKAAQSNEQPQSGYTLTGNSNATKPQGESIMRLHHEPDKLDDSVEKEDSYSRKCIICLKDEVSVVFLPCAHQVICANCNENYGKKGKATCPCCSVSIEKRVRVFGPSSY